MTITVNPEPCWIVTNADGSPTGFEDSEPHYGTEEDARKFAKAITYVGEPAPIVKLLDGPCASATTVCGYRFDEDDEGVQHWPDTAEEFRTYLVDTLDYRPWLNGSLRCPAERGCEECNAVSGGPDLVQIPGQLDLMGDATKCQRLPLPDGSRPYAWAQEDLDRDAERFGGANPAGGDR